MRILIFTSLILFVFAGCTTPSKSSKLEYLTGESELAGVKEKTLLDDLARTVYVKKKVEVSADNNMNPPTDKNQYENRATSTWLRVYPYTKPLLRVRLKNNVSDMAYKEKWDENKTSSEVSKQISAESKRLVEDKPCFAVEINAKDKTPLELKYWYGDLVQDGKSQKLTFSKGNGFVVTTRSTTVSGYFATTVDENAYYFYADACGKSKIDLSEPFSLKIEPRFARDLLPIELEWKKPEAPSKKL
jgi:hypothetical protein